MSVLWKKRQGQWEIINTVSKKMQDAILNPDSSEEGDEVNSNNISYKYKQGVLWYRHKGIWKSLFDPELDIITTGDSILDNLESEEDGDMLEIYCPRNLFIQKSHIFTPSNRCKGMIIHVGGDLVVCGKLSMTARGANVEGRYVGIDYLNEKVYISEDAETNPYDGLSNYTVIHPIGGVGAANAKGANGINGACGAGGGTVGIGGSGTSFSGGSGAGGNGSSTDVTTQSAKNNTGAGGNGSNSTGSACAGSGGAGNPGGVHGSGYGPTGGWQAKHNGENGTGGLLILFVQGNIVISRDGNIEANGSKGGDSARTYFDYAQLGGVVISIGQSGCGSGGGAIHCFHKGTISNREKITVTGGLYGHKYAEGYEKPGKAGGDGTLNIAKVLSDGTLYYPTFEEIS